MDHHERERRSLLSLPENILVDIVCRDHLGFRRVCKGLNVLSNSTCTSITICNSGPVKLALKVDLQELGLSAARFPALHSLCIQDCAVRSLAGLPVKHLRLLGCSLSPKTDTNAAALGRVLDHVQNLESIHIDVHAYTWSGCKGLLESVWKASAGPFRMLQAFLRHSVNMPRLKKFTFRAGGPAVNMGFEFFTDMEQRPDLFRYASIDDLIADTPTVSPVLTELVLGQGHVSAEALPALSAFTRLRRLAMDLDGQTCVSLAPLAAHLTHLTRLEMMSLRCSGSGSVDLQPLVQLVNLQHLNVTDVSYGSSLTHLTCLPNLRDLVILHGMGPRVSDEESRLRSKLGGFSNLRSLSYGHALRCMGVKPWLQQLADLPPSLTRLHWHANDFIPQDDYDCEFDCEFDCECDIAPAVRPVFSLERLTSLQSLWVPVISSCMERMFTLHLPSSLTQLECPACFLDDPETLPCLAGLPRLATLHIYHDSCTRTTGAFWQALAYLPCLMSLHVCVTAHGAKIDDITKLSQLTGLTSLNLCVCAHGLSLEPLHALTALHTLVLVSDGNYPALDVSRVSQYLPQLRTLHSFRKEVDEDGDLESSNSSPESSNSIPADDVDTVEDFNRLEYGEALETDSD